MPKLTFSESEKIVLEPLDETPNVDFDELLTHINQEFAPLSRESLTSTLTTLIVTKYVSAQEFGAAVKLTLTSKGDRAIRMNFEDEPEEGSVPELEGSNA